MSRRRAEQKLHFLPDKEIFEETVFDYNTLKQRFREMAFLTKGLKIHFRDLREEEIYGAVYSTMKVVSKSL